MVTYERELLDWNQKFNLTAIRDPESVRTKHFLDSFSCTLAWTDSPPRRLVDVGTGAGFPGIPLKILYPEMQLTLIESVGKKARFCEHIVRTLGLHGVQVLDARAEEAARRPDQRETYDWSVGRAVAGLRTLAEYLLPFTQVGGRMLAQKGSDADSEIASATRALELLGGSLRQIIPVNLPGLEDARQLIVIEKVSPTPAAYPRKPGLPAKQPL